MAELLIKASESSHQDPIIDQTSTFKKGDIVEVREDGGSYGQLECLPEFFVIRIDGTKEENMAFMESEFEAEKDGIQEVKTLRKFNFDIDLHVDAATLEDIRQSGWKVPEYDKKLIQDKTKK